MLGTSPRCICVRYTGRRSSLASLSDFNTRFLTAPRAHAHSGQGTRGLQSLLKELSRQTFDGYECRSCGVILNQDSLWFEHLCEGHPERVHGLCCEQIILALEELDVDVIFSVANSRLIRT